MHKKLSLSNKFMAVGGILLVVFNPLAVNLWVDALIVALEFTLRELVLISNYTMVVGVTLIVVGAILGRAMSTAKETKRLKKVKKTEKAGDYIDYK